MKIKGTTAASAKHGLPGVYVPGRRGRPPKNKKKMLKRFLSEPAAASAETEPKGFIQSERLCDYCQQPSTQNRKGRFEALLFCKDCTAKAHPSCMDYSEELSFRARKGLWQCIDCKTCIICQDATDPDMMLFCDGCDKGYHMNCHMPQVKEKPSGKWVCAECTSDGVLAEELERKEKERQQEKEREREQRQIDNHRAPAPVAPIHINVKQESGSTLPPTPAESPTLAEDAGRRPRFDPFDPGAGRKLLSKEPHISPDGSYPDATDWSVDDVAQFFTSAGFPEQAELFRDQEIDGRSLLLLKRSDIITGMSLKLGPALKIHRHIQKLQLAGMSLRD